jgi:hypothetical protein
MTRGLRDEQEAIMSALVQNATPQPEKVGSRHPVSGDHNEMRKSPGAAVTAWLRRTYRPVIEQDPTPALVYMACFFGIMFGILFLMI